MVRRRFGSALPTMRLVEVLRVSGPELRRAVSESTEAGTASFSLWQASTT